MKKGIKIGLVVLISITILIILFSLNKTSINENEDILIYEKKESGGPCANPDGGCFLSTSLYSSGRLVLESLETNELQLTEESVDTIIIKIKNSGIMSMQCEGPIILDYSATYNFNIEGETKTIYFPGCENELNTIDAIIDVEKNNAESRSIIVLINEKDKECILDEDCEVISNKCGDCGVGAINKAYAEKYRLELAQICEDYEKAGKRFPYCDFVYTNGVKCVDSKCKLVSKE